MVRFSTPKGTEDILPDEWPYWNYVTGCIDEVTGLYGYRRIETPTFAETDLFARTSGSGSDVVDKEMYSFRDRSGDDLSLRPEGTAPVMRAYLQHGMRTWQQPVKLYYIERMYRYDNPQRGRFREHHQFGCEAIGVEDAYVDVEMITLLDWLYRRLGLRDVALHLNSIGDRTCRPRYVQDLVAYLRSHENELAPLDRERLVRNPLRVLDSKEDRSNRVIEGAPHMTDYLCAACRDHWEKLLHGLDILGIEYQVDSRLVRGLDYYTRTVFEFMPAWGGAQAVVGAGGRYDGLSEAIGGPPVPGVGFGSGIERLILTLKEAGVELPPPPGPTVYVAHVGEGADDAALELTGRLRRANIPAEMAFGGSLKSQMRRADSSGARLAAIIGEDELKDARVTLRDLSGKQQRSVRFENVVEAVRTGER